MSEVDKLVDKLTKLPLKDLLVLCATAIDVKMEKQRLNSLLLYLETRLRKKRLADQLGLQDE